MQLASSSCRRSRSRCRIYLASTQRCIGFQSSKQSRHAKKKKASAISASKLENACLLHLVGGNPCLQAGWLVGWLVCIVYLFSNQTTIAACLIVFHSIVRHLQLSVSSLIAYRHYVRLRSLAPHATSCACSPHPANLLMFFSLSLSLSIPTSPPPHSFKLVTISNVIFWITPPDI